MYLNIEWFHGDLVIMKLPNLQGVFRLLTLDAPSGSHGSPWWSPTGRWVEGSMKYRPHVVLPSPGNHGFFIGEIIPFMAELFRLVKYSNEFTQIG